MNLTLIQFLQQTDALRGHPLTDTNVTQVEQTAQGVKVHVDQTELREQLAEAVADKEALLSELETYLHNYEDDLPALRKAIAGLLKN